MVLSAFAARAERRGQVQDLVVERCSVEKGWTGLRLEIGHDHGCDVRAMTTPGHVIGMQTTGEALVVETFRTGRWMTTILPSHHLFVHPAGTPLNIRHGAHARWAIAIVDHPLLDRFGARVAGAVGWSSDDPMLSHLFRALTEQLCCEPRDAAGDRALAQSLIQSLVLAFNRRFAARSPRAGEIGPEALADLRRWIEDNLDQRILVQDMADRAGCSPSHFTRALKQAAGASPHAYLHTIRLDAALALSSRGTPLASVAQQCGFADQAHLSNAFKKRFGLSPGRMRRVADQAAG